MPLLAGGAICFITVTVAVLSGVANHADAELLRQIFRLRDDAITPAIIRVTALGNGMTVALVAASTAAVLLAVRLHRAAIFMLVTTGGGMLLPTMLKPLLARPRPEEADWLVAATALAFPSGHAVNASATYLAVALIVILFDRRRALRIPVASLMLLVALLVAFSRTYLGVHYPSDVIGGFALGLTWMCVCASSLRPGAGNAMVDRSAERR